MKRKTEENVEQCNQKPHLRKQGKTETQRKNWQRIGKVEGFHKEKKIVGSRINLNTAGTEWPDYVCLECNFTALHLKLPLSDLQHCYSLLKEQSVSNKMYLFD